MADDDVARFLAALRHELRHEPDVDDVLAEVEDHLGLAVARHMAGGASPGLAVQRALASFGASDEVGRGFRERPVAVAGVADRRTQFGGLLLRVAAVALALAVVVLCAADVTETVTGRWDGWAQGLWSLATIALLVSSAFGAAGARSVLLRHGKSATAPAWAAYVLLAFGTFVSLAAWAAIAWSALLGAGWFLAVLTLGKRTLINARTSRMLQLGYLLALVGTMIGAVLTNGAEDQGHWQLAGLLPGLGVQALGFWHAGSYLADEVPHDQISPATLA